MVEILRNEGDYGEDMMMLLNREERKYKLMIIIGVIIFLSGMVI